MSSREDLIVRWIAREIAHAILATFLGLVITTTVILGTIGLPNLLNRFFLSWALGTFFFYCYPRSEL